MSRERSSRNSDSNERGGRGSERSRGGSSGYKYQARSQAAVSKRGDQGAGDFDKYVLDEIKMFKPNDGDNVIRILPPTWDEPEHFGIDVWVHYSVGPDQQTYLCLDKMKGEACPICDERAQATKDNDEEYATKLKPVKRVLIYLIDRANEKDGPIVWSMPWTIDRDLCKLVVDKRSGEVLPIDHPENGYDIEFERKGKAERTQYIGLAVARRDSDLGNDKWLQYVVDNPLDKILIYYPYDHIAKTFGGAAKGSSKNDRDLDNQDRDLDKVARRGSENESRGRSNRKSQDDEMTWDQIHDMTYEEMCALVDDKGLKTDVEDSKDDEELADWICEDLNIKKEAPKSSRRSVNKDEEESSADKLKRMRRERSAD